MDNFSISNTNDGSDAAAALYKEELNDLKIEKLGNRLTLISVLLPCLIGAILFYGYLDIKGRVSTMSDTGQTQVDSVAKDFEAKINAIEVELAKIKFSIDKDIPDLKSKTEQIRQELDEISTLAAADREKNENSFQQFESQMEALSKRVDTISGQHKTALNILDRTSKETLDIVNENSKNLEKRMESKIDLKVDEAFDEKMSHTAGGIESKLSEVEQAVESKLASLQEATTIVAQNGKTISEIEKKLTAIDNDIKQIKNIQQKLNTEVSKDTTDKQYVDSKFGNVKDTLNRKVDQLELKISKKMLALEVMIQSLKQSDKPGTISESNLKE
ncbi:hypothetical protein MTBBW1_180009 [Desulfamplus magnetovallimortis]|uniref:Uncharacterized protein n=1 Tax=Desulfamplus magnetovallimortis TaxID=1246637 RepID=A0A1W1HAH5_9BACT|nr:hypothetical protein [Desulfamplus magnetovallimortis]SLM29446.1 hypothetical protein MTBBW1_180009 [Desulfamplus magnetovallimortis]